MGGGSATIRDSILRGSVHGIYVGSDFAASALIERTEMSFNNWGLFVDGSGGATVARVSDSVITGNTNTGITAFGGGQIITFRTNMLAGNAIDGSTAFSISLK